MNCIDFRRLSWRVPACTRQSIAWKDSVEHCSPVVIQTHEPIVREVEGSPTSLTATTQIKLMQFSGCQKPLLLKITHGISYLINASLCLSLLRVKEEELKVFCYPTLLDIRKSIVLLWSVSKLRSLVLVRAVLSGRQPWSSVELFLHLQLCKDLVYYITVNTMHFH